MNSQVFASTENVFYKLNRIMVDIDRKGYITFVLVPTVDEKCLLRFYSPFTDI